MVNLLIKGIFFIITTIANAVISPFTTALFALFPSLETYFGYIISFINQYLPYIPFFLEIMLIPRNAVLLLFDYFVIKYSVHLLKQGISFVLRTYNTLKS